MNTTTQFSLLGALFVLLAWVVFSVTKTAGRKRRSPMGIPDGARAVRYLVCGLFITVACWRIYDIADGVLTGKILEATGGRFVSGHVFTVYRASEPAEFWTVVAWDCFFTLMLVYLACAEIFIALKRSKHVKSKSPS